MKRAWFAGDISGSFGLLEEEILVVFSMRNPRFIRTPLKRERQLCKGL
jgi:hypothetical protein